MLRTHSVTGSDRPSRPIGASGGRAPLPGLLRLQRTVGNAAVTRLLAGAAAATGAPRRAEADGTPLVAQRTPLYVQGRLVPGTDSEDTTKLRTHLQTASWNEIAEVLYRGTKFALTNTMKSIPSIWDRREGATVAAQIAEERHDALVEKYGTVTAKHFSDRSEWGYYNRTIWLLRSFHEYWGATPTPAVDTRSTPDERLSSRSSDLTKKRRIDFTMSASIGPARTSNSMLDPTNAEAPDNAYVWRLVVLQVPYEDLPNLMQTATGLWTVVSDEFRERVADLPALNPLLHAVIRCVARYSPRGTFGDEPEGALRLPAEIDALLLQEVTRALGWREYSCALRRRHDLVAVSLRTFVTEVLQHTELTRVLREKTVYPKRRYGISLKLTEQLTDLEKQLVTHWRDLAKAVPPSEKTPAGGRKVSPATQDSEAYSLAKAIGALKDGHNIAVEHDNGRKLVYSNRVLTTDQQKTIKDRDFVLIGGTNEERNKAWGKERGIMRNGPFHIPYHAEMQRSDYRPPWQFRYAGNMYFACVQCMAGYYSLGIAAGRDGGYLGTHASKAPSIIPPTIRTTSVYLQHYLGTTVWEHISRTIHKFIQATKPDAMELDGLAAIENDLTEIFLMLDDVERAKSNLYDKLEMTGGPSQTFGPKFDG